MAIGGIISKVIMLWFSLLVLSLQADNDNTIPKMHAIERLMIGPLPMAMIAVFVTVIIQKRNNLVYFLTAIIQKGNNLVY